MEKTITKDILKKELLSGVLPAIELLYSRYSGMLFSYILQFIPEREEAEELLVNIFSKLTSQLQDACESNLSIYCWLQVEARKIILEYAGESRNGQEGAPDPFGADGGYPASYFTLLQDASPEQQWVFRELFLKGRPKEELALQLSKDKSYIDGLLLESLVIFHKNLGVR